MQAHDCATSRWLGQDVSMCGRAGWQSSLAMPCARVRRWRSSASCRGGPTGAELQAFSLHAFGLRAALATRTRPPWGAWPGRQRLRRGWRLQLHPQRGHDVAFRLTGGGALPAGGIAPGAEALGGGGGARCGACAERGHALQQRGRHDELHRPGADVRPGVAMAQHGGAHDGAGRSAQVVHGRQERPRRFVAHGVVEVEGWTGWGEGDAIAAGSVRCPSAPEVCSGAVCSAGRLREMACPVARWEQRKVTLHEAARLTQDTRRAEGARAVLAVLGSRTHTQTRAYTNAHLACMGGCLRAAERRITAIVERD